MITRFIEHQLEPYKASERGKRVTVKLFYQGIEIDQEFFKKDPIREIIYIAQKADIQGELSRLFQETVKGGNSVLNISEDGIERVANVGD